MAEFGERGFGETSIVGITSRAGVALGTFYTYFDSKEAVFQALVRDMSSTGAKVELKADCIEVKARRGASQPFVKITSEHQLADVPDRRLWLAVLAVDKVQRPHGRTLTEHVDEVKARLEATEPSAIMDWDMRLADAGYDALHDYSAWRWIVAAPEFHAVAEGFPRVAAPIPLGVTGITYSLALSACAPWSTDWNNVRSKLVGEDQL